MTHQPAPGTLSDEEQARFSSQMLSLIRATYGERAGYAIAIGVPVPSAMAFYISGSTDDARALRAMFETAAESLEKGPMRRIAIDEGTPEGPKQ